jgi:hypothetical protein
MYFMRYILFSKTTLKYEAVLLRKTMKFDRNYKTNVKLSLRLIKHQAVKTYGGVEIVLYILNLDTR